MGTKIKEYGGNIPSQRGFFAFFSFFRAKCLQMERILLILAQNKDIMKARKFPFVAICLMLMVTTQMAVASNVKESVATVAEGVTLMTDVDYIITGTTPFADGAVVNIVNTDHAVVIFENIKPSIVIAQHLGGIQINGEAARNDVNCQVKMYAQGSIVFPYAKDIKPLTVYSEPNFGGESVNDFGLENSGGFMNTLTAAKLNNRIRSFKLKRGYMVTFALGTGGWGYSRCFIADQEDLEIATLPANMDSRISSYRVFKWQNAQKKGLASDTGSGSNGALNTSWCYTWSNGENRLPDTECVPNHIYEDWPSPASIGGVTYACHMKTNNEPGNSADDHPQDVNTVLNNWQNLMRTGMRLCSETSHDGSWNHLKQFISAIDSRGWRCDLLDLHCYWASGSFWSLESYYADYGKRPIWISEFVWGASWNNNGIFSAAPDGKNSFSTANQQANYNGMKPILEYLNSLGCVERYAYWNSEADCSKIYKNGQLSILGKYYSTMKSGLGYNPKYEKIPTVVYTAPTGLEGTYDKTNMAYTLKWSDSNGDMADSMVVERKLPGESKYVQIATVPLKDRNNGTGTTYTYTDTLSISGMYLYRVGVYPIKAKAAKYSNEASVSVNKAEGADGIQWGVISGNNTDYTYGYFSPAFDEVPTVILGPVSNNNSATPLCHHLHSVKNEYFQYQFMPWSLSSSKTMDKEDIASFIALTPGNGTIGTLAYEAGSIKSEQMDSTYYTDKYGKMKGDTALIHFLKPFPEGSRPVVFVNVVTTRETYPLMWKICDVTHDGFKILLKREAGRTEKLFTSESVSYLAIEQGSSLFGDGKRITVSVEPDFVGGNLSKTYTFPNALADPILWVESQTAREPKAMILRYSNLKETGFRLRRVIDTSESSTASSVYEDMGWMVISNDDGTAIRTATADATPVVTEYYDLSGRRLDGPADGIIICRTRYSDGTTRTKKICR